MPKIIDICGVKNSGKTTLITRLVRHYSDKGVRVAVIKHDGHDFDCDIPGTDTHSYTDNGAYAAACFSGNRVFVHKQGTGETERELMSLFPEADIIFLEGLKGSSYSKIEVIRDGISDKPVSNPEGRFLIATDLSEERFNEPACDLNDTEKIAGFINDII